MKTLHLQLKKGINTIKLIQLSLDTTNNSTVRLSKCFINWSLKNIRTGVNDQFEKSERSELVSIPEGYYTFSDLQTYLATHEITIEKTPSNHIEIESKKDLDLKAFGPLLGFTFDKSITKDTKTTSESPAQFTNGLKNIHIHCPSLVDYDQNYSSAGFEQYLRSSLMLVLYIDTTQSLNGTFTNYPVDNVRLPCRDFVGQDLEFIVESGAHINDYEIYLVLEID